MTSLVRSYRNFRFLVRSVRWIELAISAVIVILGRQLGGLQFPLAPVMVVFALGFLWNWGFWYAGRRHLLHERGPAGARLLVWSWVVADVVTNLLVIALTGATASPFLFFLAFPVILSTVALGRAKQCYGLVLGTTAGLAAVWAMDRAGSIPHFSSYPVEIESTFLAPRAALGIMLTLTTVLSLLVHTIFRFRPNFFVFQDAVKDGHFQLQSVRPGHVRELSLEEVEAVGPEDLLEEAVQGLTLNDDVAFGAAIVLPAGNDTVGGAPGLAWHHGLTRQRVVSTARRQVIPTWNEFEAEGSTLFKSLRNAEPGDLFEGPFEVLRNEGLFPNFDDADSYLACTVGQNGRPVVVLVAGLRHPVRDRDGVVLHLLNIAAQLKPLLVAEARLSQMRTEMTALINQNEALTRANKLQSDFVSIASHELKTPLTAIGAYTGALLDHADDPHFPERAEFLEVIRHENERLLRMVNRILDFSQIEFGNRALNQRAVSPRHLIDEAAKTLGPQLESRQQDLVIDFPGLLPQVEVDADLLKQVFLNLIGNASKFSPEGSQITVRCREQATTVEFEVEDQGPGIPEDEVKHVFRQFYRVRRDGEQAEGSGLGLTIVHNIIEMHGGQIEVDGGQGERGATFRFQLPKQQCVNDERVTVLGDVTRRPEFQHLLKLLTRTLAEFMDCKIVSLMLLSADRSELFVQVAYGLDEEVVRRAHRPVGEGIAGRVAESGRPLLVEDLAEESGYTKDEKPQYETRSLLCVPMKVNGQVIGVINCNNKVDGQPFSPDDLALLLTLTEKFMAALSRALEYENTRDELERAIEALEALLRLQSEGVASTRRASRYAMDLGRRMGLNRQAVLSLQYACVIHDIGMAEVDEDILRKSGPLTEDEREQVQSHPRRSLSLAEPIAETDDLDEIIRYHHERVDGTGYPAGLTGERIPLAARILSVVDAYDSMTSDRAWRRARRPVDAVTELVDNAGTQFDTEVVDVFLDVLAENGELNRSEYLQFKERQSWLHPASS